MWQRGWIAVVSLLWAQLSGVYWINGTTDPTARSFATLQAALDELSLQGAQDTVLFRIVSPYDPAAEPSTIQVKGYTCTNCQVIVRVDTPITIAKAPAPTWQDGGQFVLRIQGGVQRFALNGRGNLRLKSLSDTSAFTGVVGIVPRQGAIAAYIRIDSCSLEGASRTGTWAAFYIGDSASYTLQPAVYGVNQIVLHACTLRRARYGAAMLSSGWGSQVTNVILSQNVFGFPTTTLAEAEETWAGSGAALYARYVYGFTVEDNTFEGCWETGAFSPVGVQLEYCHTVTFRRNRIANIKSLSPQGYGAVGLHLIRETRYGASPHLIENNFIGDISGSADESLPGSSGYLVAGVLLESDFQPDPAASITLRHNTIVLAGVAVPSAAPWAKDGLAAGVVFGKNVRGGVELSGNLIQNTLALESLLLPDAKQNCALLFWENRGVLQWSAFTFRNNFYYVRGRIVERSYLVRVGWGDSVQYWGSLAEWKAFSGQESGSVWGVSGGAPFVGAADWHIDASQPWIGINAGPTPLLTSEDYDGEARPIGGPNDPGTAPDIGADEVAGATYLCTPPASASLTASVSTGQVGQPVTLSVSNPSALAGELSLLGSVDGGLSWVTLGCTAGDFPLEVSLPQPASWPGAVVYRLVAAPPAGCPGSPDTSAPLTIQITDRPGNRLQNALALSLSASAPGVWEASLSDSLLGWGISDEFSPRIGASMASRSPDLFYTLTLPACLDSLEIDLCGPSTDFDTRLHGLIGTDTVTDRDQGYRSDCTSPFPGAYTSRIVLIGSGTPSFPSGEDYTVPARGYAPLAAGTPVYIIVEGETALEVGHFTLTVRGYALPLPKPDLGPDRNVCLGPNGITVSAPVLGALTYTWWIDGQPVSGASGPDLTFQPSLGSHTIVVEAARPPVQPCALPQSTRDTVVLTVLSAIEAAIVYNGLPQPNGDTLTLPFGTYTFLAQAQSAGASFAWRLWDAQGVLIDWTSGSSYTREWGVRGLYLLELTTSTADCEEKDTLYLRIQPEEPSSLPWGTPGFACGPNPSSGEIFLRVPSPQPYVVEVYDALGRCVQQWLLSGSTAYYHSLPLPTGLYRIVLRGQGGTIWSASLLQINP